jgi:predicted small lipoprotein YifL
MRTEAARAFATALAIALATVACGLKGDLYIPPEPEAPPAAEAAPQTESTIEETIEPSTQPAAEEEANDE